MASDNDETKAARRREKDERNNNNDGVESANKDDKTKTSACARNHHLYVPSNKKQRSKRRRRKRNESSDDDDDSSSSSGSDDLSEYKRRRRRRHRKKRRKEKRKTKRSNKRHLDSSSDDSSSSSSSSTRSSSQQNDEPSIQKQVNQKLLAKLAARGETLEERQERKAKRRAAKIQVEFGYTAEDNPFNDPNIHETFTWNKKKTNKKSGTVRQDTVEEIKKVRQRRLNKDAERQEVDRLRAEEARMKEQEKYDDWMRKEEEFHLLQQRQRSAIRLVEGREKPIDVLAKNILLFGLSDEETTNHAAVKYKERYNALNELETMEAELEEPHVFLKVLKLNELEELLVDIDAFRRLERESSGLGGNADSVILRYWDALHLVTQDEIEYLKSGGAEGEHAKVVEDITKLFEGQSEPALVKMKDEIITKLRGSAMKAATGDTVDVHYWQTVLSQLDVYLAKKELSNLHEKMLVRQLERLEKKKEELKAAKARGEIKEDTEQEEERTMVPKNVDPHVGDLENELGLDDEIDVQASSYSWQDKWRPRKPRYFNRVKTGYDWNKYNQTHYDHDNPPPKIVQGYKFNIFYPDLIDKTKTPQFFLEKADSPEFCILRFHAGPPYEDIAFKIINREWNRSRKRGFRSTFERGVLSLYFNFATHWYRR
jgi:hypothetical protein